MGLQRSSGNSPKLTMENDPFVFVYHLLLKPWHFHGKLRDLPSFATPQVPSFQGSSVAVPFRRSDYDGIIDAGGAP